ncbi:Tail fiber protein [Klebsiella pneumoniae]|uniref:phage tail protein n=1 Tax=Klebsiella pneumoniae TaxID=573 RepID=UPI000E2D5162|nr:phage tail protein [Klebsiella pneumoniae]SWA76489.1 Tail fiber protein [Klebsiella pneumoniae]SWA87364.1 Tail fiber protein [Klebsiella pneumoniae]HBQ0109591.1 phage tail protein [Klebsiella pneumoniae]HBT6031326.1 phage tail protein [Klebsiella pneumoniae]HBT6054105.1 phage tail protein [Klebsiella pneumoniae]
MAKYSAILTRIGLERMAAAAITGDPVDFAEMAVGDGSGTLPEPDPERSALVNEVYRSPLNRLVIADKGKNIIRAEMVIPPQVGGFTLREAALYDSAGICLAIASLPESYKPLLAEGAGRVQAVNIWIAVSNTDNVQLTADLSVVMATVAEVEKAKSEGKDYTDQVATVMNTSLETAIKDAIEKAKRDFWEEENPQGTVRFFAQNIDPNEKWPWSEWVYTGENKTIRVAKADASNVGLAGGNDSVTLQKDNLPAVKIDVSGETSELPEATLTTKPAGRHKHGGVPSRVNPWEIGGDVSQRFNPANLGNTDEAEDHQHEVVQPAHKHTTSGKTANLGSGQSFSVVEAHILLMCWARVA